MTALVASLGFAHGAIAGAQAVGYHWLLWLSVACLPPLLTLLVLPILYIWFEKFNKKWYQ
jgi:cobalt-zinc-cadmium resistance protein CzcA